MAIPASTANWHWKSKAVTPWARSWFESELPTVIVTTTENITIGISSVTDVEGDVELGMRKSKLITIFDVRLVLKWSATHPDGTNAGGSLTIPEVSHEVVVDGLTDYAFDWSLDKSSPSEAGPSARALLALAKTHLPPRLKSKFEDFPKILLETHGKDLVASPSQSGTATPSAASTATTLPLPAVVDATTSSSVPEPTKVLKKLVNSSTVRVEAQFMVSGDDLFGFLTDEARIPSWSRAPAKSSPVEGAAFSLFGGGVVGNTYCWKLKSPTWPNDHEGTLTATLDQQSDSTKLVMELSGVPKGQEDEIERNLTGY
ncbi:hypothetical protein BS47DRAFT_1372519 [Hydnum rufescens UP504]|uniref:Activator of Hsp90 ATPase AHSA1-like N-terminal domain-containing protein n=1 Tax=Hydnum rufescens UP504 TaxID=1448309 RepID=A0A9P6DW76_9AGAM|nr:hypothetical protein BS47DRAFT_1372519 [Hydnum rufescens UP504]